MFIYLLEMRIFEATSELQTFIAAHWVWVKWI